MIEHAIAAFSMGDTVVTWFRRTTISVSLSAGRGAKSKASGRPDPIETEKDFNTESEDDTAKPATDPAVD